MKSTKKKLNNNNNDTHRKYHKILIFQIKYILEQIHKNIQWYLNHSPSLQQSTLFELLKSKIIDYSHL